MWMILYLQVLHQMNKNNDTKTTQLTMKASVMTHNEPTRTPCPWRQTNLQISSGETSKIAEQIIKLVRRWFCTARPGSTSDEQWNIHLRQLTSLIHTDYLFRPLVWKRLMLNNQAIKLWSFARCVRMCFFLFELSHNHVDSIVVALPGSAWVICRCYHPLKGNRHS